MATEQVYRIIRGDTIDEPLILKDSTNQIVDVSGWTWYFTLKKTVDNVLTDTGANVIYTTSWTVVDGTAGTRLTIANTVTTQWPLCECFGDLQYKKPNGTVKTFEPCPFPVEIIGDVTRRSS